MKKYNPTSPSRRQMTGIDYSVLAKVEPLRKLLIKLPKHGGRNNQGRITMRHQGGENKKFYRVVDFKQDKLDIPGKIEAIEYDPYRTAFIARVAYKDGDKRYILASKEMKAGMSIITSENAPLKEGSRLVLKNIPVGQFVYNIELSKGRGGQLARSAGSYAKILAHEGKYTHLKMSSGEVRKVLSDGFASIGEASNGEHILVNIGKAGRQRHLGVRPTVRGSVMNPRDHPYGGGEGRQRRGTRRPKTKWGKVTGGRKTRNKKKYSNKMIVERRKK